MRLLNGSGTTICIELICNTCGEYVHLKKGNYQIFLCPDHLTTLVNRGKNKPGWVAKLVGQGSVVELQSDIITGRNEFYLNNGTKYSITHGSSYQVVCSGLNNAEVSSSKR